MLDTLLQDLRYALRGIRRSPGFALAVVLTLGLAIGANAALFSVVDVLLFRQPAGVADPGRVRQLVFGAPSGGINRYFGVRLSYPDYRELRERTPSFSSLAAFGQTVLSYGRGLQAQELKGRLVSANYFSTLGVRPAVGAFFPPVDDRDLPQAVVLGFDAWRGEFGGDRGIVGRSVVLGGRSYQVLGVAPRGFRGIELEGADFYLPVNQARYLGFSPDPMEERRVHFLQVVGRLAQGVSTPAAAGQATAVLRALKAEQRYVNPNSGAVRGWRAGLAPINDHYPTGKPGSNPVPVWLLGVTAALLLIACVNVANLLLARGIRRRRELAIRVAVGADRGRLVRQLLVETALLAMLSAALALVIAYYSRVLLALLPLPQLPPLFGGRVFLFTLAVALVTLLVAGVLPALRSTGLDVERELKDSALRTTARGSRLRQGVMAGQLALSLVLLVGAGLFLRSLHNVRAVDLGYDADHLLAISASLRDAGYSDAAWSNFDEAALGRLVRLPGARSVALGLSIPARSLSMTGDIVVEAKTWQEEALNSDVTPGYFRTMGVPLVDGRDFTVADASADVAIVNRSMARRYWGGVNPIGRCFRAGNDGPCLRVVGVVGDMMMRSLGEGFEPMFFQPLPRDAHRWATIMLRVRGDPRRLAPAIRRELAAIDPAIPYVDVTPLADHRSAEFAPWRMAALVTVAFGALALLLAIVGLYGVIAFLTAQRRREIGIRSALGAEPRSIARLVLGEGVRVALGGCALGSLVAIALARLVHGRLYGVSPADPVTYAAVILVLGAAALLACYVPARRAARVDPTEALRAE